MTFSVTLAATCVKPHGFRQPIQQQGSGQYSSTACASLMPVISTAEKSTKYRLKAQLQSATTHVICALVLLAAGTSAQQTTDSHGQLRARQLSMPIDTQYATTRQRSKPEHPLQSVCSHQHASRIIRCCTHALQAHQHAAGICNPKPLSIEHLPLSATSTLLLALLT